MLNCINLWTVCQVIAEILGPACDTCIECTFYDAISSRNIFSGVYYFVIVLAVVCQTYVTIWLDFKCTLSYFYYFITDTVHWYLYSADDYWVQIVKLFIVLLTEDVKVSFVWVIAITAIFGHTFVTKRLL